MAQPLLSPINDYVFKRVFGENLTVLAAFLSAVLGIAIRGEDLAVIDPNFRANRAKDHLGILDVRVKT
ncbi:MAG: PD-(D/E)XK nuclease family transposase [Desulfovibrio sp.]|nr:PD-(D/E)XK nuclease family transposase [Desulfovibrio sp.]